MRVACHEPYMLVDCPTKDGQGQDPCLVLSTMAALMTAYTMSLSISSSWESSLSVANHVRFKSLEDTSSELVSTTLLQFVVSTVRQTVVLYSLEANFES